MTQGRRLALQILGALAAASFALGSAAQGRRTYMFSPVNQHGINLTAAIGIRSSATYRRRAAST